MILIPADHHRHQLTLAPPDPRAERDLVGRLTGAPPRPGDVFPSPPGAPVCDGRRDDDDEDDDFFEDFDDDEDDDFFDDDDEDDEYLDDEEDDDEDEFFPFDDD